MARITSVGLTLLLALSVPVAAGTLAPRRASDVVVVGTSAGPSDCAATEYALDQQRFPDGSTAPFAIPAKRVLVVQSIDFYVTGSATPGKRYRYDLSIDGAGSVAHADAGLPDDTGNLSGSFVVAPGVVIAPGALLCSRVSNAAEQLPAFARVHGFLAKDR